MLLKGCGWLSRALGLAAVSLKRRDSSNRKPNRRGLIRTQRTQPNRQRPSWHSTARIVAGTTGFSGVWAITGRSARDPGNHHPRRGRVTSPRRRYPESAGALVYGVLSALHGVDPPAVHSGAAAWGPSRSSLNRRQWATSPGSAARACLAAIRHGPRPSTTRSGRGAHSPISPGRAHCQDHKIQGSDFPSLSRPAG